jgi:hypothetical protein
MVAILLNYIGGILVKLDLLPSLRGTPWVPHRQAPEHFMVELEDLLVSPALPGESSVVRVLSK